MTALSSAPIFSNMLMFFLNRFAPVLLGITVCLLTACQGHQTGRVSLPLTVPDQFSKTGTAVNPRWWMSFNDPTLTELVERVLSDNLALEEAWARLDQARALAELAAANRRPILTADADAGRSRSNIATGISGSDTEAVYTNRFSLVAAASYEVDLWGRLAALDRAARLDAAASRHDLYSMAVSLTAETTDTWFSLIEQQSLLNLVREQLKTNRTLLELVRFRFANGLAPALDVFQQRQLAAANETQIPPLESRLQVLRHRLAVLMGRPPRERLVVVPAGLPDLPPLPDTGLPAELLRIRPDLRAAEARLAAADERVAEAVADRFPALRLQASGGYRATELNRLFENLIWDILGNLSDTLWDAGRESAEVLRRRAVVRERAATYARTALIAFQEVEDALTREAFQRRFIERLTDRIEAARGTFEQSGIRYRQGLTDYLPVLTALSTLQTLEQTLITARRELLAHRIALHRALGGIWPGDGIVRNGPFVLNPLEITP